MLTDITVIGQYAAGRDIHLQVELTPKSARMIAEALLQLQKNGFSHCVINPIFKRTAHAHFVQSQVGTNGAGVLDCRGRCCGIVGVVTSH